MTYGRDYTLAEKMQKQFKDRGSDVSGMRASSTADLMRRAEMGHDPRVNCAEQAFRENYRDRTRNAQGAYGSRTSQGYQNRSGRPSQRKTYSASYKNDKADIGYSKFTEPKPEPAAAAAEIVIQKKGFPVEFIAMALVCTVLILVFVLFVCDSYQTSNEIARLEAQIEELDDKTSELKLQLAEKNDIRTIERIATEELGMVKEDSLQRRYISLSSGEYIELLETEDESEEQTGGLLLSSIFSALGEFFDRFK